jgi:hypothetical protein
MLTLIGSLSLSIALGGARLIVPRWGESALSSPPWNSERTSTSRGDRVEAEAAVDRTDGRKRWVKVVVRRAGAPVFAGEFLAVVLDQHILDR